MPTIIIASQEPRAGRTAVTAGLGALLATEGRTVRLARTRSADGADALAEDDAQVLANVPGCSSTGKALTEQDLLTEIQSAADAIVLVEAPAGNPKALAERLSANVVFVTPDVGDEALGKLSAAASELGETLIGVIAVRQSDRMLKAPATNMEERGLTCLAVLPEDRLLAGPSPRELSSALHASTLVEGEDENEAVEFVMLGPVSADPGQPYFLQHGTKAVVNRFDKMDLHLAALATEPDCLILTGGQQPSPYLLDRVAGIDPPVTVLLAPDNTVRTIEVVDGLYGETRFGGQRKLDRAIELANQHLDLSKITAALA